MTAKIIQLRRHRSAVRCRVNGVAFPQVYRTSGFYVDPEASEKAGKLIPSNRPATCYGLSEEDEGGFVEVTHTPIRGFTTGKDNGWLFVRHHMREEFAEGYLDAIGDHDREEFGAARCLYRTETGIFTLVYRTPTPGCPNHLVVYVSKVPDIQLGGWMDHYTIVLPDGSISEDSELLVAP